MLPRASLAKSSRGDRGQSSSMSRTSMRRPSPDMNQPNTRSQKGSSPDVEILRKRKRAIHREKLYAGQAKEKTLGTKSFLERRAVSTAREVSYRLAWEKFLVKARRTRSFNPQDLEKLDQAATNHLNRMFWEGDDLSAASTLASAVVFFTEGISRISQLPKMAACMKGFRKLDPPKGRVPIPFPMLCRVCEVMTQNMQYQMALWLMTTWAVCARPGETLRLERRHVVKPSRLCKKWIIVLNSGEHQGIQATSKVGESDEALEIDQEYLQWLGPALMKSTQSKDPSTKLFPFQMSAATQEFQKAVKFLQYDQHSVACVYQIRHGAASTDVLQKLRTLEQVQKRGRWATMSSVRRYSNGGRISQVFQELSKKDREKATSAEKRIAKILDPSRGLQNRMSP